MTFPSASRRVFTPRFFREPVFLSAGDPAAILLPSAPPALPRPSVRHSTGFRTLRRKEESAIPTRNCPPNTYSQLLVPLLLPYAACPAAMARRRSGEPHTLSPSIHCRMNALSLPNPTKMICHQPTHSFPIAFNDLPIAETPLLLTGLIATSLFSILRPFSQSPVPTPWSSPSALPYPRDLPAH